MQLETIARRLQERLVRHVERLAEGDRATVGRVFRDLMRALANTHLDGEAANWVVETSTGDVDDLFAEHEEAAERGYLGAFEGETDNDPVCVLVIGLVNSGGDDSSRIQVTLQIDLDPTDWPELAEAFPGSADDVSALLDEALAERWEAALASHAIGIALELVDGY